jgi:hypothetical protein
LKSRQYDFIFITETWLNDNISDAEILQNTDYEIIRKDRQNKGGGGVALIYRKSIHLKRIPLPDTLNLSEVIICDLSTTTFNYRIILCYRPPNIPNEYNELLLQTLRWASESAAEHFLLIIGDFNLPNIKWNYLEFFHENTLPNEFVQLMNEFGLSQIVEKPTLGQNFLDIILCQHVDLISNLKNTEPFSTSDHDCLVFDLSYTDNHESQNELIRDFSKGNYEMIESHLLAIDWHQSFSVCSNIEQFYNIFLDVLNQLISLYIPYKKIISKFKYPKHILKLQSEKRQLWKKLKRSNQHKSDYKKICSQIETAVSSFYASKEKSLLERGSDLKHFFKYFNSKIKLRPSIPDLTSEGKCLSDDESKADAFNKFFGSVFAEDNKVLPQIQELDINNNINVKFTPDIVLKALNNLKPTFSIGPDGICAFFIKQLKQSLCKPLSIIYEVSYRTGKLPSLWLQALVIPIFKKGLKTSVENYRPISLCCVTCKLMETIINEALTVHCKKFNLIRMEQYGFQKQKSCTLQLLNCVNKWSASLDSRQSVDIAYIDFQKAFDSVVHTKLTKKLEKLGIKSFILAWIHSFLSNRVQMVKINAALSRKISVTSGVPQGSVLGPTLFLIYINDLVNEIHHSQILLFADDLKIFNLSDNHHLLQADLTRLVSWSEKWQLPISLKKSNVLYLGKSNPKYQYSLNMHILEDAGTSCKDLGVFISNDLSNKVHCNNIVAKASRIANMIHRCFISKDIELRVKAFKTYVRPILEYSSVVWNPHLVSDIQKIENVQRRFTKRLLFKSNLPYENRLNVLNLERLELRRIYSDAILAYKIINFNLLNFNDFYRTPPPSCTRSAQQNLLYIPKFRLDCRKFDFSIRSARIWNSIPVEVKDCRTISSFIHSLHCSDFDMFLKGRK